MTVSAGGEKRLPKRRHPLLAERDLGMKMDSHDRERSTLEHTHTHKEDQRSTHPGLQWGPRGGDDIISLIRYIGSCAYSNAHVRLEVSNEVCDDPQSFFVCYFGNQVTIEGVFGCVLLIGHTIRLMCGSKNEG